MDERLNRFLSDAESSYGASRAGELRPFLEQAAADITLIRQCLLEPGDAP